MFATHGILLYECILSIQGPPSSKYLNLTILSYSDTGEKLFLQIMSPNDL